MRPCGGPLAAFAIALGACTDSPVDPSAPPDVQSVSVELATSPLVRLLDVTLEWPAGVQVDYWSPDGLRLRVTAEATVSSHRLVLARLRPATTYEFEVRSLAALGEGVVEHGSFTTDSLPTEVAAFEFTAEGVASQPLTLFEINRSEGDFQGIIIVDDAGVVVWYFKSGPVAGTARLDNLDFVFLDGQYGALHVAPTGDVVHRLPQEPEPGRHGHHDVIATPDNTLLFIAHDTRHVDGRSIVGEAIWEWDPETGSLERRWSAFDHLSPDEDWSERSRDDDWLHANSLALGPAGNVLMSLRSLSQVISIAPDFQSLEWRLGGINADIAVIGDTFRLQHSASELASVNGRRRVLLFDNGTAERAYSRALEVEIDSGESSATPVWQFRPTPDNFSAITSLARRMPNGNTFVAFGAGPGLGGSFGPVEAFEVDPTGAVLFHIEIGGPLVNESFVLYRASPLTTIAGEQVVQ